MTDWFPLSKPQQRIYALERFAEGAAGISASALFHGKLDAAAMQRALHTVIKNNDALRLRLSGKDAQRGAMQYIVPPDEAAQDSFPVCTFASQAELHAWAKVQALEPMDMTGALYRFTIITVGDCFGFFLRFHHLISDAWSATRFTSLVYQQYRGVASEEAPSYLRYLEKEARYQASERALRDREFWLDQFPKNAENTVFLARSAEGPLASKRLDITLSAADAQPIRQFAAEHSLSLFNVLLLAMAVYLYRIRGGNTDFYIGANTFGRDRSLQRTLGMFVGIVPVPIRLHPERGFRENAVLLKGTLLSVLRHEAFSTPDILQALRERDGSSNRPYDVLINYQNAAVTDMDEAFAGTWWYPCGVQPEALQLHVSDRDNTGGLYFAYDYHTAQFSEEEMQLLHQRLLRILTDAVARPETPVSQLDLQCEADRSAWEGLNRSVHPLTLRPVHRFFEEQAVSHPARTAVIFGEKQLTYGELHDWVQRIACWLRSKNLKPGGVVALQTQRSLEMMPLILGILRLGCAYLPISPDWPDARIQFILKDAGAELLVCQPDLLLQDVPCPVESSEALYGLPQGACESCTDPNLPVYILYTSGSTGQPKGVRVGHGALCNRLLWQDTTYPLDADEILIQKTTYTFDVSAWELFWALMQGRTLLLPDPGVEREPRRLIQCIQKYGIRTIHFVPSMLALFLDELEQSHTPLPSLGRVIVSGEALSPALCARFYACFSGKGTTLHNLYGPTECAVDVLYYDCQPGDAEIPIGRPVWNTGAYVLDKNGALLPPGEIGELCITGVQLAHGYANPALDVGRFETHPQLGRMYRTGDQCSLRTDGQILYHGRADGQVKIRGQRVELGEVERGILQVPGIRNAAVIFDGERLRAFYCGQASAEAIMQSLQKRLPAYMLPDALISLDALPLNANGKLDRKKLTDMESKTARRSHNAVVPPATEIERQLIAAVLAYLPAGECVGIMDRPDRCGLSSLDIVRISLDLEAQGLKLEANDFYAAPDFRTLAAQAVAGKQLPLLYPMPYHSADTGEALACIGVPYGGGSFSAWSDVAQQLPLPFFAVQSAHEDPNALLHALRQLPFERFLLLGSCVGGGLALAVAQTLEAEGRLAGFCAAASVPPSMVRLYGSWLNPWQFCGPTATNRVLQRISKREIHLGKRDITRLRQDAAWFLHYLAKNDRTPLQVPACVIYGGNDSFLPQQQVRRRWERLLGRPIASHVIPDAKHDILHTHPQEVAHAIQQLIAAGSDTEAY